MDPVRCCSSDRKRLNRKIIPMRYNYNCRRNNICNCRKNNIDLTVNFFIVCNNNLTACVTA